MSEVKRELLSPLMTVDHIRIRHMEGAASVNLGNNWIPYVETHRQRTLAAGGANRSSEEVQKASRSTAGRAPMDLQDILEQLPNWVKNGLASPFRSEL
ncbi:hypothetical protein LLE49_06245 [Alicyclobacillus tolerans]|uniref:hypothetical protein n=1 Tax=Alicyclobacillus tolerans TaxID=90970 RepID=UPI001F423456|nr:hypothetical protein [Alicyclobacillus tolerans]MCF8564344.1 hypothetical protein [Alicyclobacillus tolerans]